MADFLYDPKLFRLAMNSMDGACSSFKNIDELISAVTNFPSDYKYQDKVLKIVEYTLNSKENVNLYADNLVKTNDEVGEISYQQQQNEEEAPWLTDIKGAYHATVAAWQDAGEARANGEGIGGYVDAMKQTKATLTVAYTTIQSGGLKIVEWLDDGNHIVRGYSAAGFLKLYDMAAGTHHAEDMMDSTLDFVRRDRVGELNDWFYGQTAFGREINKNSNLKYDSAGAAALRNASTTATVIAAATAATIASGGSLAPIMIGAIYGGGKSSEHYAQTVDRENGEGYNYSTALWKTLGGTISGALEWWGHGSLGKAAVFGIKLLPSAIKSIGAFSPSTFRSVLANIFKVGSNASKDDVLGFLLKNAPRYAKNYLKELFCFENIAYTEAIVGQHLINIYTGDETWDEFKGNMKSEAIFTLIMTNLGAAGKTFHSTSSEYSGFKEATKAESIVDKTKPVWKFEINGKNFEIPDYVIKGYESNRGQELSNRIFYDHFTNNGISLEEFHDASFKELTTKLNKSFKTNGFANADVVMSADTLLFRNLDKNSVYTMETTGGLSFKIFTNEHGVGRCLSLEKKSLFGPDVMNLIYNQEVESVKLLGKHSKVYDMKGYEKKLFHNGGDFGVNQGCLGHKLGDIPQDKLLKLRNIVIDNIPGLSKNDAFDFLHNIDRKYGVCSYAAPLNTTVQANPIVEDKEIFRDCFGFDFINPKTKTVNEDFLLADMVSYVNKDNTKMFRHEAVLDRTGEEIGTTFRYAGAESHKNQRYLGEKNSGLQFLNNVRSGDNEIFINYFNSRLDRGARIHGEAAMEKYRPKLQPYTYEHRFNSFDQDGLFNVADDFQKPVFGGKERRDYTITQSNHPLTESMKQGKNILQAYPDDYLPMYKLSGGAKWKACGGGHAMSIIDDVGDGLIVDSWGDVYYLDKRSLNEMEYYITGMDFGK